MSGSAPMVRRRMFGGAFAVLVALALPACSGDAGDAAGGGGAGDAGASDAGATSGSAEGSPAPLIDEDFPDPDVLKVDDTYYAYATEGNSRNVRVAQSTDLQSWEVLDDDALPVLPSWIIPGKTWAPEVTQLAEGRFVLYFTATNFDPSLQCIGVATASSPTGPFEVQGEGMLVCPEEEGGAIDASTFREGDTLYLLWKNDGNCCGKDTWIQMSPLSEDGLSLAGETTKLISQTLEWEGELVEAPTLLVDDEGYVLLYSANSYGDERYAIGAARAESLQGPWVKGDEPFFSTDVSGGEYLGPGGQDVVTGPNGDDILIFHAWDEAFSYRGMYSVPLDRERLDSLFG